MWGAWSSCQCDIYGGKRTRHRSCDRPAPARGGKECVGESVQYENCNNDKCTGYCHLQGFATKVSKNLQTEPRNMDGATDPVEEIEMMERLFWGRNLQKKRVGGIV